METLIILGMMLAWPLIAIAIAMAAYYLLKVVVLIAYFGPEFIKATLGYNDNQDNKNRNQSQITHVSAVKNERSSMQQRNTTNNM